MNKRILSILITVIWLIILGTDGYGQCKKVMTYEMEEEILEHNQLPLDPYPPFGLLTGYITYPFQFYGSKY